MRRQLILASAVATVAHAVPAAAGEIIRPCQPGTPQYTDAKAKLDAVDAEIRQLLPAADPGPLRKRLRDLGKQACFRIAADLDADAKSGLALRTWWEDGGHTVAAGALQFGGAEPIVWVAPDVRRALTRETSPEHRLAPLLCPAYDDTCGRDTDGWRLRAEAALARDARARHLQGDRIGETLGEWKRARPPTDHDCTTYAGKAPRRRRLTRYQHCLDVTAERSPAFPIGRVKKPTEGWLVVSGRRGHYDFCDELRAFDLATGSMYRVASCSGLALVSDGSVDHRATDASRKMARERGTVSLDEIREAAWMLLQLGELDKNVLKGGFGRTVPKGIPLESDDSDYGFGFGGWTMSINSGQTHLTWTVTAGARELGSGTITWPRDLNDDEKAYATELLEVAESSFTPGCPPAAPPPALAQQLKSLSAHRLDTDAKSLGQAASSLDKTWGDLLTDACTRR